MHGGWWLCLCFNPKSPFLSYSHCYLEQGVQCWKALCRPLTELLSRIWNCPCVQQQGTEDPLCSRHGAGPQGGKQHSHTHTQTQTNTHTDTYTHSSSPQLATDINLVWFFESIFYALSIYSAGFCVSLFYTERCHAVCTVLIFFNLFLFFDLQ